MKPNPYEAPIEVQRLKLASRRAWQVAFSLIFCLGSIAGAVVGMFAAQQRFSQSVIPSSDNLQFAAVWGLLVGIVPSCAVGLAFARRRGLGHGFSQLTRALAVVAAIAVGSGVSLYTFALYTASV